jgi:hypothetical protein
MENFGYLTKKGTEKFVARNGKMAENVEESTNRNSFVRCTRERRCHNQHFCLFGILHLTNGMKILISTGLFLSIILCVLEAFFFRRALCVMIIPIGVVFMSALAVFRRNSLFLWPIIGISFFHLFLDAYATIVFLFFLIFKPLYIIMVLNWAFDNMHPNLSPYYAHCAVVLVILVVFFLFNFWQLRISLCFQAYLDEILNSGISTGESTGSSSCSYNNFTSSVGDNILLQQPQCRILSNSPSALLGDNINDKRSSPETSCINCSSAGNVAIMWHSPQSHSMKSGV